MFPPIRRVVIILGKACNFNCVYCMREGNTVDVAPTISPKLLDYLHTLTPDICESVVMTGGEPLLYLDKIKELVLHIPTNVHKKIITNGSLLTDDIVNYVNEHNIEINLSHDGKLTEHLRGVNVLDDPKICNLIKKINILAINATVTTCNSDVMEIYTYLRDKLDGRHFILNISDLFITPTNAKLLEGFDYEIFKKSFREYFFSHFRPSRYYNKYLQQGQSLGINFLLNGDIVDMFTLHKYGTVFDSIDHIREKVTKFTDDTYCRKHPECPFNGAAHTNCFASVSSNHYCTIRCIKEGWI